MGLSRIYRIIVRFVIMNMLRSQQMLSRVSAESQQILSRVLADSQQSQQILSIFSAESQQSLSRFAADSQQTLSRFHIFRRFSAYIILIAALGTESLFSLVKKAQCNIRG